MPAKEGNTRRYVPSKRWEAITQLLGATKHKTLIVSNAKTRSQIVKSLSAVADLSSNAPILPYNCSHRSLSSPSCLCPSLAAQQNALFATCFGGVRGVDAADCSIFHCLSILHTCFKRLSLAGNAPHCWRSRCATRVA